MIFCLLFVLAGLWRSFRFLLTLNNGAVDSNQNIKEPHDLISAIHCCEIFIKARNFEHGQGANMTYDELTELQRRRLDSIDYTKRHETLRIRRWQSNEYQIAK